MAYLSQRDYILDNEIAWLRHMERVLNEALDETVPLLERQKCVAEFYSEMEKFTYAYDNLFAGDTDDINDNVRFETRNLMEKGMRVTAFIQQQMAESGIVRVNGGNLTSRDSVFTDAFLDDVLSNHIRSCRFTNVDNSPYIDEDCTYFLCRIQDDESEEWGLIELDSNAPQIYILDYGVRENSTFRYIFTSSLVNIYANAILGHGTVTEITGFRINRSGTFNHSIDGELKEQISITRKLASPVGRLIMDRLPGREMLRCLVEMFSVRSSQIYTSAVLDWGFMTSLCDNLPLWQAEKIQYADFEHFNQLKLGYGNMIDRVRKKEIFSAYPYDSMDPLKELLKDASTDDRVREIRLVVNDLARNVNLTESLITAAMNGKKVKIVLTMRGSEPKWIDSMENGGCRVIQIGRLRIHAGMCQVIADDGIISYFSTSRIDEKLALTDADFALLTSDTRIGEPMAQFFNDLLHQEVKSQDGIITSPADMRKRIIKLINREAENGPDGLILIKTNKLSDEDVITALVNASSKGCPVRIICNDICRLVPGIPGYTDNIRVVSIRGRINEHSRVFCFGKGSREKMFLSSTELTQDNLDSRTGITIPVYGRANRDRIREILIQNYMDNVRGRSIDTRGCYVSRLSKSRKGARFNADFAKAASRGIKLINSQEMLIDKSKI